MPRSGPDGPPIYVPVQAEDQQRNVSRKVRNIAILVVAVIAGLYYVYQHNVSPIQAREAFDAGARQLQSARYAQAILSFDRAIALAPDYVEAYQLRGRANMALTRPLQAGPDFTKTIALRPQSADGYLDRSGVHLALDEFQDAFTDASRAIQLDPKLSAGYNLRGAALRKLGNLKDALADYNKAVELSPDMDNYFQRGATYEELGDHEHAISDFNEVIGFQPLSSQPYYARAKSFRALGDEASAERDHNLGRVLDGR
jgi:tetratricopeptide (TPR) repeat protein